MFDEITDELHCPFCGALNNDFQTKDLGCMLSQWSIKDIKKFVERRTNIIIYDRCKKCDEWIEIVIKGEVFKEQISMDEHENE